ncbi:MAG: PAS domain S-box protein, partial [Bacteroidales bacterium]|nr:PAS domain S-box protein [Bacteroidales bacterium]
WPVEYVSKNVDKIFGYNVDEFISGKIVYSDLIHPDDFKVVSNEIIENVDSVSISHKIYRVFSKNGEIKWIKNETFIRRDENGQITHYEGILFDVSEQEKTLQKLKIANIKRIESENKYKNIIETLNDWIWEIDNTGKYTYVNPKVFSILGYSENEVLGKTPFDFMPENEKSRLLNVFNDIMRHQGPINKVENINIHKNGTFVVIETSGLPFYDSDNNVLGYRGIDRDITLRKKAEVELLLAKEKVERSEKRFKKISELTFEGIIMHRGGIVIDINKSFVKLSGYEIEELVGKNIIEQLIPPKYHKTIALKMEEKHPSPYDIEFIRKDGTLIPVEIESYSDNYDNKEIRVTVVRDIREKKESEKRVLNAMIEAEERERERFARELHDGLGPLLSTLKMYFQWLADTREEKKIELILSQARENIEEAISTVEEISNNITPRTLNAFGIKAAVRTFIGRLLGVNDVDINFYCSFETRIDQNIEIAIYRIITELINNTLKYANAGQISISITLNTESTNIAVQYYDNGNGFNYEETIKANKGFGLGNIRQRIKMLGSFLEYKTEVGRGVNVYFECKV